MKNRNLKKLAQAGGRSALALVVALNPLASLKTLAVQPEPAVFLQNEPSVPQNPASPLYPAPLPKERILPPSFFQKSFQKAKDLKTFLDKKVPYWGPLTAFSLTALGLWTLSRYAFKESSPLPPSPSPSPKKEDTPKRSSFQKIPSPWELPPEINQIILSFLPEEDLLKTRLVCKHFNYLYKEERFKKPVKILSPLPHPSKNLLKLMDLPLIQEAPHLDFSETFFEKSMNWKAFKSRLLQGTWDSLTVRGPLSSSSIPGKILKEIVEARGETLKGFHLACRYHPLENPPGLYPELKKSLSETLLAFQVLPFSLESLTLNFPSNTKIDSISNDTPLNFYLFFLEKINQFKNLTSLSLRHLPLPFLDSLLTAPFWENLESLEIKGSFFSTTDTDDALGKKVFRDLFSRELKNLKYLSLKRVPPDLLKIITENENLRGTLKTLELKVITSKFNQDYSTGSNFTSPFSEENIQNLTKLRFLTSLKLSYFPPEFLHLLSPLKLSHLEVSFIQGPSQYFNFKNPQIPTHSLYDSVKRSFHLDPLLESLVFLEEYGGETEKSPRIPLDYVTLFPLCNQLLSLTIEERDLQPLSLCRSLRKLSLKPKIFEHVGEQNIFLEFDSILNSTTLLSLELSLRLFNFDPRMESPLQAFRYFKENESVRELTLKDPTNTISDIRNLFENLSLFLSKFKNLKVLKMRSSIFEKKPNLFKKLATSRKLKLAIPL